MKTKQKNKKSDTHKRVAKEPFRPEDTPNPPQVINPSNPDESEKAVNKNEKK